MSDIYGTVRDFCFNKGLLTGDEKNIIVGFSGGADSVCLLFMLKKMRDEGIFTGRLVAAHLNHCIRGDEAKRDEEFVKAFCLKHEIELICTKKDIPALSADSGESEEAAGRRERYLFFNEELQKRGGGLIATAHHKNDLAETVIINIARGTGLAGLTGIKAKNENIIRPLICLTKQQITEYNKENGLEHVEDSTNLQNIYVRNYIRNEIFPGLEANVNTDIVGHIYTLSEIAGRADELLKADAGRLYEKCFKKADEIEVPLELLKQTPRLIREYLYLRAYSELYEEGKDLSYERIEETDRLAMAAGAGRRMAKVLELPHGVRVKSKKDSLVFFNGSDTKEETLPSGELFLLTDTVREALLAGEVRWLSYGNYNIKLRLTENFIKNDEAAYTKYFDYVKMNDTVCFRMPRSDDFITVRSDETKHSLKQELKNRKVPAEERGSILILADGNECLWAVGVRRSMSRIATENTIVLEITVDSD